MKPLFTLLSLIIFMTPAWADLHKFDLPPNTLSYDVNVILANDDNSECNDAENFEEAMIDGCGDIGTL